MKITTNGNKSTFDIKATIARGKAIAEGMRKAHEEQGQTAAEFYGALVAHYGADIMRPRKDGGINFSAVKSGSKMETMKAEADRFGKSVLEVTELARISQEIRAVYSSAWGNMQAAYYQTGAYAPTKPKAETVAAQTSPEAAALDDAKEAQDKAHAAMLLAPKGEKEARKAEYDAAKAHVKELRDSIKAQAARGKIKAASDSLADKIQVAIDAATAQGRADLVEILTEALTTI